MFWILVCVTIAFLLNYLLQDLYLIHIKRFPPGPLSLPIIGGLLHLSRKQPHFSVAKLVEKYGKILSIRMGTIGRFVFLHDIKHINQIFDSVHVHDRPDMMAFHYLSNNADGIGSCNYGERWKFMTQIFQRGITKLSHASIETRTIPTFDQLVKRFIANSGRVFNPKLDVLKSCSAVMSSLVYGTETESIDSEELQTRIKHHNIVLRSLSPGSRLNMFPFLWYIPNAQRAEIMNCVQKRDHFFNATFKTHSDRFDGQINDIIDILAKFDSEKAATEELTPVQKSVRTEDMFLSVWTIYLAGCDTMTDSFNWLMLYLSVYTDVQMKVQAEIDQVINDDTQSILENKNKLNYTRATILETLRLSSSVALGLPHVPSIDIQLERYNIPKGTVIMPHQWYIHHDPENWPDPFKLKPERFLDENTQLFSTYHIFQKMPFIPFSRGKRVCLGQSIALDLLLIFTCVLMKKLTVRLPEGTKLDLSGQMTFNLQPNDFCLVYERR